MYQLTRKPKFPDGYAFLCYSEDVHDFIIITVHVRLNIDLPLVCDKTNFRPPEQ